MKQLITNHLKNLSGWKSNKKYLVFVVDDYGNVRLNSAESKSVLLEKGVQLTRRFDKLDALDTKQDFEQLFEALSSVKNQNGRSAIFSPYAMTCNIDFEATMESGVLVKETLDATYRRLEQEQPKAFEGAFDLMKEGISKNLIRPQFHGTLHLNENLINALLKEKNEKLMSILGNKSLVGISSHKDFPNVSSTHSYAFHDPAEIENHKKDIIHGLDAFEKVYSYRSLTFNPPAQRLHKDLFQIALDNGVIGLDKPRTYKRHLGNGIYEDEKNLTGVDKSGSYVNFVRNCVFEPNDRKIDWVNYTFEQIKAAFFWKRPAIVSSHRVNFAGHIDPENRKMGLDMLKKLLKKVVAAYPDVEFIAIDDLCQVILKSKK